MAREQGLAAFYSEDPEREVQPGEVMTYYGRVLKGFEYPLLKFLVISESDIFGSQKKKKKKKKVSSLFSLGVPASADAYFWITSSPVARI